MLTRTRTVLVGEDDGSGIIYFASYFRYMAEGDHELFERLGHAIWDQINEGFSGPAVNATCNYLSPARAGDRLEHRVRLLVGRSSLRTEHEWRLPSGAVGAEGGITRCWVDLAKMEPVPVPDWMRDQADGEL
jgi:acyl-CoA thioesterase FadM